MRAQRKGRLARRLLEVLLSISLLLTLGLGVVSWMLNRQLWSTTSASLLRTQAESQVAAGDRLLRGIEVELRHMAGIPLVANALADSTNAALFYFDPLLRSTARALPDGHRIALCDFSGRPLWTNDPGWPNELRSATASAIASSAPTAMLLESQHDHEVALVMPVIYAMTGTAEGALVVRVPLQALDRAMAMDIGQHRLVIGNAEPPEGWSSHPLGTGTLFASLKLHVHAGLSDNQRREHDLQLPVPHLLLAALLFAFAGITGFFLIRRTIRPLEDLANVARRIADTGDTTIPVPDLGDDEAGALAQALRAAFQQVSAAHDQLEAQVTARTAALAASEREAHRLSLVAAKTSNAVIITDAEGRVTWVNNGFTTITGYTLDEMRGRKPGSVLQGPESDKATVARIRDAIAQGHRVDAELLNYGRDGRPYWIAMEIQPLRDAAGLIEGFMAIESDVTERRQREADLRAAIAAAESANRAKSAFLANMSHEIRTPMNGVLGLTEILLSGDLTPEQREHAEAIYRSGELLLAILNDILDLSKIEAGRMELQLQPVDLIALCGEIATLFRTRLAAEVSLDLDIHPRLPRRFNADPVRLRQILANLVGNAVKFTKAGRIILAVRMDGDRVRIDVRDTGIGIPSDRIGSLFTPFTQADASTSRKYGGTGLGLAISRLLCELMSGSLTVESTLGSGSCFTLVLPLAVLDSGTHPMTAVVKAEPVAVRPGLRILMAEDNATNRAVARLMLNRVGAVLTIVEDGQQALDVLRARADQFDLVLMDCQMPHMDGYEATAFWRREEAAANRRRLPIIALTANTMDGDAERCLAAGMDAHVGKPVSQASLNSALAAYS